MKPNCHNSVESDENVQYNELERIGGHDLLKGKVLAWSVPSMRRIYHCVTCSSVSIVNDYELDSQDLILSRETEIFSL
jgi:hypothetical protein